MSVGMNATVDISALAGEAWWYAFIWPSSKLQCVSSSVLTCFCCLMLKGVVCDPMCVCMYLHLHSAVETALVSPEAQIATPKGTVSDIMHWKYFLSVCDLFYNFLFCQLYRQFCSRSTTYISFLFLVLILTWCNLSHLLWCIILGVRIGICTQKTCYL